ncbi:MAG: hypothetical protein HONBIEJF_01738 [Fimbriimonadaceae bacterium]|nr:hypothetical protein [Fimbriimonadaceae bacterium]
MATSAISAIAYQDGAGQIIRLEVSGACDECAGSLQLRVIHADTAELLALTNAQLTGTTWSRSFDIPEDIRAGAIDCGQQLIIELSCFDGSSTSLQVDPNTLTVDCQALPCSITVLELHGTVAASGGLSQLNIIGAATNCTGVTVIVTNSDGAQVTGSAAITGETWTLLLREGDPGVGTELKSFECFRIVAVEATCADNGCPPDVRDLQIQCGPCLADVEIAITRSSDGQSFPSANLTCTDSPSGTYSLRVLAPDGGAVSVLRWTESQSGAGDPAILVDANGDPRTDNPLSVDIGYAANEAVNTTYSALVVDSNNCIGEATATFSCGGTGDEDPGRVDCRVSRFTPWSRCIDGFRTRTRRIIVQPQNGGSPCPPLTQRRRCRQQPTDCVVSEFSAFGPCVDGLQSRSRTVITQPSPGGRPCPDLVETRRCSSDVTCDPCCIFFWVIVGLVSLTAIFTLITFCMLDKAIVSAIVGLALGVTWPAGLAVAGTIQVMLWICLVAAIVCLVLMAIWAFLCVPGRADGCGWLRLLMLILSGINLAAAVLGVILSLMGHPGCFLGAIVLVLWGGVILSLLVILHAILCPNQ